MNTRPLTQRRVGMEFGFGAAQIGNLYRETTEQQAEGAVQTAWDGGVRYFDTAPHYGLGLSERRLGRELAAHPRDDYVLSTKVGRLLVPSAEQAHLLDDEGFAVRAEVRREWDFSRDGVRQSLESSLERLGLDRVDVVYLHDPDHHWESASTTGIAALVELRDEGVIGAVGVGMNQSAMLAEFVNRCDVDVVMLAGRYTILDQSAQDDLLPVAQDRGVSVVAAGVFNSGLAGSTRPRPDATYDYVRADQAVRTKAVRIAEVCESWGVTLAEAALQFPLRHRVVTSVVVGCRTAAQVAENLQRREVAIPDEVWLDLEELGLLRPVDAASSR